MYERLEVQRKLRKEEITAGRQFTLLEDYIVTDYSVIPCKQTCLNYGEVITIYHTFKKKGDVNGMQVILSLKGNRACTIYAEELCHLPVEDE